MNDILIAGILFPAIPLAMNNVSGRYRAVAGLIRNLHDTMEQPDLSATKHSIFMAELVSLKRRMHLIKASQFFWGAFLCLQPALCSGNLPFPSRP